MTARFRAHHEGAQQPDGVAGGDGARDGQQHDEPREHARAEHLRGPEAQRQREAVHRGVDEVLDEILPGEVQQACVVGAGRGVRLRESERAAEEPGPAGCGGGDHHENKRTDEGGVDVRLDRELDGALEDGVADLRARRGSGEEGEASGASRSRRSGRRGGRDTVWAGVWGKRPRPRSPTEEVISDRENRKAPAFRTLKAAREQPAQIRETQKNVSAQPQRRARASVASSYASFARGRAYHVAEAPALVVEEAGSIGELLGITLVTHHGVADAEEVAVDDRHRRRLRTNERVVRGLFV